MGELRLVDAQASDGSQPACYDIGQSISSGARSILLQVFSRKESYSHRWGWTGRSYARLLSSTLGLQDQTH